MKKIDISNDVYQDFKVSFEGALINVTLRYIMSSWYMDVSYNQKSVNGIKISSGVKMLEGKNYPFDFIIDSKGKKLDPFLESSFSNGDFDFYLLERADMETVRGFKVE